MHMLLLQNWLLLELKVCAGGEFEREREREREGREREREREREEREREREVKFHTTNDWAYYDQISNFNCKQNAPLYSNVYNNTHVHLNLSSHQVPHWAANTHTCVFVHLTTPTVHAGTHPTNGIIIRTISHQDMQWLYNYAIDQHLRHDFFHVHELPLCMHVLGNDLECIFEGVCVYMCMSVGVI